MHGKRNIWSTEIYEKRKTCIIENECARIPQRKTKGVVRNTFISFVIITIKLALFQPQPFRKEVSLRSRIPVYKSEHFEIILKVSDIIF